MTRETIPTHAGTPSQFRLFGLEGRLFLPMILSLLGSIICFAVLSSHGRDWLDTPTRLLIAALPFLTTTGFILLFVQGKPPHWLRDHLDALGNKGAFATRPRADRGRRPPSPLQQAIDRHAARRILEP